MTRGFLAVLAPDGGLEAEAVLLVVSELLSNAMRHGGGVRGFGLRAALGTVTITVEDASWVPPRPRSANADRPGGLGWPLVHELAVDVRVSVGPHGKTVAVVLPLPRPGHGLTA